MRDLYRAYFWYLMVATLFIHYGAAHTSARKNTASRQISASSDVSSKYSFSIPRTESDELSFTTPLVEYKWSEWSKWSECSRSCGGGVMSQTRECIKRFTKNDTNPKLHLKSKKACQGAAIRSHICNDNKCPTYETDFRTSQCLSYNKKPFSGVYYSWEPYIKGERQCVLNCKPTGYLFYATLNETVIDGTSCTVDGEKAPAVCVRGICKVVGCDGVINGQRYDACGVCGGDNSTCKLISGLYTKPHLVSGYNYIAEIPQGACNLSIADLKKTNNLLALRYKNGSYILNGNWISDKAGSIEAVGTNFTFTKGNQQTGDIITAPGPLSQPIDLLLLYKQENLGIKYEYRVPASYHEQSLTGTIQSIPVISPAVASSPINGFQYSADQIPETKPFSDEMERRRRLLNYGYRNNATGASVDQQGLVRDEEIKVRNKPRKQRKYIWKITSYSSCSRTCGAGFQSAILSCVRENSQLQTVADKRCSQVDKPIVQPIQCTLQPCPAQWVLSEWSSCSASCGEGIESRNLSCKQEISQDTVITVADANCLSLPSINVLRTRPCFQRSCNGSINVTEDFNFKPYWYTGSWTLCSTKCGNGVRTRKVICISKANEECDTNEKPAEAILCNIGPCDNSSSPNYSWLTTDWTAECSENCGNGIQTRKLYCSAGVESESSCDLIPKPEATRVCSSDKRCTGQWFAGPWTQCSEVCGWGKQRRIVLCVASDKQRSFHNVVSNSSCVESEKPSMEQACFEKPCTALWYAGSWSTCTRKCDSGIQRREVRCLNEELQSTVECAEEEKPATRRSCNTHQCSPSNDGLTTAFVEDVTHTRNARKNDSVPVISTTQPALPDIKETGDCKDKYTKCNLVVRARLCNSQYYQGSCCFSCRKALATNQ